MKKWINLFVILLLTTHLCGCSFVPRMTFDTKNTVPQQTEKSKEKYKCSGRIDFHADGSVKSCTKGYYSYDESFNKTERKMTIVERIKSFINALVGSSFWIFMALIVFCPSLIGFVFGKLIEGTVGITGRALKSTVRAVNEAKNNGGQFMQELGKEHSKDVKVQKKINELRADES